MSPIRLNDKFRVALIPLPRQWVLEQARSRKGQVEYRQISFCCTKRGLMTAINEKVTRGGDFYGTANSHIEIEARLALDNLPERL